jgi:hypothetical protein
MHNLDFARFRSHYDCSYDRTAQHSTAGHGTARPAWHSTAQHQGRSTENRNAANLGALLEKAKHFTCICIGAAMKHNWYQ